MTDAKRERAPDGRPETNPDSGKRPDEVAGGANEPQHLVGDYGEHRPLDRPREGLPTNADPHPANEEHYDREQRPGGANPPRNTIGPNDAVHDGKSRKRPPPRPGAPG
jgi:hypothetical protein